MFNNSAKLRIVLCYYFFMKERINNLNYRLKTDKIIVEDNCFNILLEDLVGDDFVVFKSSKNMCFLEMLKRVLLISKNNLKSKNQAPRIFP